MYIREGAMEHVMFKAEQHAEFEVPVQPPGHVVAKDVEQDFVPPYCYYLGTSAAWLRAVSGRVVREWCRGARCATSRIDAAVSSQHA